MKEIKAYVSRHRIADVIDALRESGVCDIGTRADCHHLTVSAVQRPFAGADPAEQHYSMDLGGPVVTEYRLELVCADADVDTLVAAIAAAARTGAHSPGWIVVSEVARTLEIG